MFFCNMDWFVSLRLFRSRSFVASRVSFFASSYFWCFWLFLFFCCIVVLCVWLVWCVCFMILVVFCLWCFWWLVFRRRSRFVVWRVRRMWIGLFCCLWGMVFWWLWLIVLCEGYLWSICLVGMFSYWCCLCCGVCVWGFVWMWGWMCGVWCGDVMMVWRCVLRMVWWCEECFECM